MLFLKFVGVISGIFGLMFLFTPKLLVLINSAVNKILMDIDNAFYKLRIGIGISLCFVSITMFFIVYYMVIKFGVR